MAQSPENDAEAAEGAERRERALKLRLARWTFEAIGRRLGISKQRAHQLVQEELRRIPKMAADELRTFELEKLDRTEKVLDALVQRRGEQTTYAAAELIKIAGRRAKLLGLDAPTRTKGTLDVSLTDGRLPKTEREAEDELLVEAERIRAERAKGSDTP